MSGERQPTPSQTVGPFFGFALPFEHDYDAGEGEQALRIEGRLTDGQGQSVPDGLIEVWSGDQFARCRTDEEGAFRFVISRPQRRPGDGDAPHLDVAVFARGLLRHLVTRMYLPDESASNAQDRVLRSVDENRRSSLIAERDGQILRFDIRLQGEKETVFFAI
ncbi:MAG TPA: protocatechuate 3,4-dioxygenase subunit alpha [Candidatus Dormibacteraeota bacterium]|nr:protocatechuate 3,4-dioxygenase subunit alpha [Candidatus Dormibacteraeota bacterium]